MAALTNIYDTGIGNSRLGNSRHHSISIHTISNHKTINFRFVMPIFVTDVLAIRVLMPKYSNQIKSSLLSYWDKVRYTAITNSTHCHMSQNKNHVWLNTKYRSRITKQKCSDLTHRDMSSKHSLMNTNCYQYDNGSRKPQWAYGLQIW